jgi:hypothetical protein
MITREHFVQLRTHRNNIQRFRRLLETSLTDFERQFIEEGLAEDQVAIETLAAQVLPKIVKDPIPRTTLAQRLVAARRDTPGLIEPT